MEMTKNNSFVSLSDNEMVEINGGDGGLLVALGTAWVLYEIGYAVGKAIAHATTK